MSDPYSGMNKPSREEDEEELVMVPEETLADEGTVVDQDYFAPEINELGMQALQVYQGQRTLADRLWAYFHQYSAMMILLALLAVAFRNTQVVKDMKLALVLIPFVGYLMFFIGNHMAMRLSVMELQLLKGVAIAQTRLPLRTSEPGSMMLFHLLMAFMTGAIYWAAWLYALYWA